jgi:hypothetical protein
MPRRALLVVVLAVLAGALPARAHAAAPPTATCTVPGSASPQSCSGWFRSDVTVSWAWDPAGVTQTDCNVVTITADTKGASVTCRVWYGDEYVEAGKVIRRDATPPAVTGAAPERGPDADGWFNHPVAVGFSGTDATSGLAGCEGGAYGGPDSATATVSGTCRDVAGNTSSGSFTLRYDATSPAVAVAAARAPDANGWYRSPVAVAFTASDGLSGVASCDPSITFSGPDTEGTTLSGTCRDAAGNAGTPATLAVRYDSKPPAAPAAVTVAAGDKVARVSWDRAPAAEVYELWRAPGVGKQERTLLFRGPARSFTDRRVRNGVRYRYEVLSLDQAGNTAGRVAAALPRPPVFAPASGAVVGSPPRAAWEDVKGARFYNAQLYRGRTKILSTWVVEPRLRLRASWLYGGRKQSLVSGRYRLYVWPAFGTRMKPRYGKLLGGTVFVVRP